ncbi:MAG: acyltransferase domain-containing protein [Actinobacteria bacterium]|nr:MAG: acyltransferase domain-containing protein [Actinomycetota bacterium]
MEAEGAVAVIGMACRYPGASGVDGFWAALRDGTEGITHFDRDDLVAGGADPELVRRVDYVPARGVLAGSRNFDWSFFGYSRAEAATIDPQHRVFLECAAEAIDDAGIDPARFPGWIGVYAGAEGTSAGGGPDGVDPLARIIGQRQDFLTTRVAYKLGLRGPALTVQTACSTSLTAVHMAVQGLQAYECDAALAGGVSVAPPDECGYLYQEGGILSPDGHCRPFDENAAGTVPGDGVGIVVLKRLADALRDGDRIAAVIRGSAINNDGADKIGFTAPSISGQRDAILLAQRVAGVDPADIRYVEAHGTGTRIGDPVEVQALTDAFHTATDGTGWCWIGAVKSNIGHTGSAAGVAGLIKTVLMLEHGELVPTLHYRAPNPLLKIETTPFRVCAQRRPWPADGARLAAISSFGVGGTNAHVIVAAAPRRTGPQPRPGARILALSSPSVDALARLRRSLAEHLGSRPRASLVEMSWTLAGRRRFSHRQALVVDSRDEAYRLLRATADPPQRGSGDRIAFLFPGQGTLGHAAGAAAYRLLPGFAGYFAEVADAVRDGYGIDLSPVVTDGAAPAGWFTDTVHQQLGVLALGYALGRRLLDWGVTPALLLGNSIGEYTAATLAGLWTPSDAAAVVYERASAMRATEPGRMAAVSASVDEVRARIGSDGPVAVAVAGPERTVISGAWAAMDRLLAGGALTGFETRLIDTDRAFHSVTMEPATRALRDAVASTPHRTPSLPMVSTVTGELADAQSLGSPDYWARQLRRTVRLDDGIATVLAAGCDILIELGAGTSMTGAARRHRNWTADRVALPLLGRPPEERNLLRALGTLWEHGADIDLADLLAAERPVRCALPAQPLDSRDPEADGAGRASAGRFGAGAPTTNRQRHPAAGTRDGLRTVLERLWCAALGVPSVTETDDFYALGGESLMAVTLVNRVREQTASAVTVAEFTTAPTFGRLVELVRRHRSAAGGPVPGIVPLREGGAGRPLFLAADATGTTAGYRTLAGHLDAGRPVFGLEPAGRAARHPVFPRIEEIAAGHVDAALVVQGCGPYALGGWSFGAVVAHEMARQLIDRGAAVETLVFVDGYAPARKGLPIATAPGFLAGTLRLQAEAILGIGTIGGRLRRAPELRRRFVASLGALLRYRPAPVPCPAVVFRAGVDRRGAENLRRDLATLYSDVQVHPMSGDHWSILAEPHVRDLAEKLRSALPEPANSTGGR